MNIQNCGCVEDKIIRIMVIQLQIFGVADMAFVSQIMYKMIIVNDNDATNYNLMILCLMP